MGVADSVRMPILDGAVDLVYHGTYHTRLLAGQGLFSHIEWFFDRRYLHSSIGCQRSAPLKLPCPENEAPKRLTSTNTGRTSCHLAAVGSGPLERQVARSDTCRYTEITRL
jgi:hypothetical protein